VLNKVPLKTKQFVAEVTADPIQKMDWEQMVQVSRSDGHFSTGQSTQLFSMGFLKPFGFLLHYTK
jgi:hypothetical protein